MTEDQYVLLYNTVRAAVMHLATTRLGPSDAEDVFANSLTTVWEQQAQLPADEADWARWVMGIAKNKTRQEHQRRTRKHHDTRFIADWAAPGRESAIEDSSRIVIDKHLGLTVHAQLNESEKLLLDIAYIKQIPVVAAAHLLGISVTAYTTRLSRLRAKLTKLYIAADTVEPD